MKTPIFLFSAVLALISVASCNTEFKPELGQKTEISGFLGQWTIDIEGGSVGWLEVRQEDGYLDGEILWGGGSVLPVSDIFLANERVLIVQRSNNITRKTDDNNNAVRTQVVTDWLEIIKVGDTIQGILLTPRRNGTGVDTTKFTGVKLPPPPPAPDLKALRYGDPIILFNATDLTGWKLVNEKLVNGFKVVNGELVNDPVQKEGEEHIRYGNLRTVQEFEDFNLILEVNVPVGSNSGVYLRGMYEVQVVDSYKKPLDSHNMGAVYSRITPIIAVEKPGGEWQSLDITLCDRHATVILNGVKIIDNQPIYGPTGGAIKSDVFSPGPIYLQGDHGKVTYRRIALTPIIK